MSLVCSLYNWWGTEEENVFICECHAMYSFHQWMFNCLIVDLDTTATVGYLLILQWLNDRNWSNLFVLQNCSIYDIILQVLLTDTSLEYKHHHMLW